jgi:hypothetical protein
MTPIDKTPGLKFRVDDTTHLPPPDPDIKFRTGGVDKLTFVEPATAGWPGDHNDTLMRT